MDRHSGIVWSISAVLSVCIGCSGTNSTPQGEPAVVGENTNTPEGVYRRFMIANLSGDENAIRPLILDNDDAHVLWQGAYPEDVAAILAEQYRTMEISPVGSPDADHVKRVLLHSSASPIPLAVVDVEGTWKVDASPIIEFRKAGQRSE